MNILTQVALSLLVIASAVSPCVAQAGKPSGWPPPFPPVESGAQAWTELRAPVGRFSVRLPSMPKSGREEVDTPLGKLTVYFVSVGTDAGMYGVAFCDFPNYSESPEFADRALDGARYRVLAVDASRRLLVESKIDVEGHAGREWFVADARLLFRARTFLVKERLYQVLYMAPLGVAFNNGRASASAADRTDFYEDNWKKFFGSFKLLPEDTTPYGVVAGDPSVKTRARPREEGEVDRLVKSLREKGETVVETCKRDAPWCKFLSDIRDVTVDGGGKAVIGGMLSKPEAVYPPAARAARVRHPVVVEVLLDEGGRVIAAQAGEGHPALRDAAVEAARAARFNPTLLEGKPVKVSGALSYTFGLP